MASGDYNLYATRIDKEDTQWFDEANCKGTDTDSFFIERGEAYPPELKEICYRCSVRRDCLDFALKYNTLGFWGGTSEMDRRHMSLAKKMG